jgi:hypothetical protein
MQKQLFFSHDWRIDTMGRNNHKRVHALVKKLQNYGYSTWFDEEDMNGNIDSAMADGIEQSEVVIICITETYCNKINNASRDSRIRDNCLKEWTYANARGKLMIPLIMEPNMLNTNKWPPGVMSMYLASTLYISAIKDDDNLTIISLIKRLEINGIKRQLLPPIKFGKVNHLDKLDKLDKVDKVDKLDKVFKFESNYDYLEDTSPISPPISPIKKLRFFRSKTTNFTATRLTPLHFPGANYFNGANHHNSNTINTITTRVRAKNEIIRSRQFNLNCAYLPNSMFNNPCMPRRVSI